MAGSAHQDMVFVPAGEFLMGDDAYAREAPLRRVDVDAFWIDRFPVTNAQWMEYVRDSAIPAPRYWGAGTPPEGLDSHPVLVSWLDAAGYAEWAGKRLPTEAEWEKAARGTDGRRYPWGDEFIDGAALTWEISAITGSTSEPVTARPQGASPYGCEQMVGLTEEWVADWYQGSPESDYKSQSYGQRFRTLKGGAWIFVQTHARCSYRCFEVEDLDGSLFLTTGGPGFRCAADVEEMPV